MESLKVSIDLPNIYIDELMHILSMVELPKDLDEVVYKFIIYMRKNKRFRYSKITDYIYTLIKSDEDGIYFMDENIKDIIRYCTDNEKEIRKTIDNLNKIGDNILTCDKFFENIEKVGDYIALEIHRIQFNKRTEINTRTGFIDDLNNNIRQVTKETTEAIKKTEGTIHTSVISVLGIFAAFIASYFGGLNTFTSVMSNLGGISKFRLVFIVLLLGVILFNVTFILLWFISKMLKKNMGGKVPFSDINDYEDLKWYKEKRKFELMKRVWKKYKIKGQGSKILRKKLLKEVRKYNNRLWIKRVYFYHKIKFKRFPILYIFNAFCVLGMLGSVILKCLDFYNIFKF